MFGKGMKLKSVEMLVKILLKKSLEDILLVSYIKG